MRTRIRHTILLSIAAILAGVAVYRMHDYRKQDRLDGLGGRLHAAVERNDVEAVRHLLEIGAPVDSLNRRFDELHPAVFPPSPLFRAVHTDADPAIIRLLIAHGADMNFYATFKSDISTVPSWSVLTAAAMRGNTNSVQALLDADIDVNWRTRTGQFALYHAAAQSNNAAVVRMLLERGADVNATWEGTTALRTAQEYNRSNTVDVLIEYGATASPGITVPPTSRQPVDRSLGEGGSPEGGEGG